LADWKKLSAKESSGISFVRNRGSSGKIALAATKAIGQAGGETARKARPLRHRPRVPLPLVTERPMDATRSGKASRVCIPSADNHEMGHDSIERLLLGKVIKYSDNDNRDPRVALAYCLKCTALVLLVLSLLHDLTTMLSHCMRRKATSRATRALKSFWLNVFSTA
jgi:hypothetical protein